MKMQYIVIVLLAFLYAHRQVYAKRNIDIAEAFQQACPYTNFCTKNASRSTQDNQQAPCCQACSCDEDCWKRDNCCPDKTVKDKGEPSELEPCKDTRVRHGKFLPSSTSGLLPSRSRYYVTETCPEALTDAALEQKCAESVAETLVDLIWVSDPNTNRIYANKWCAECHGIRKYKQWRLSTTCAEIIFIENYSENIRSVLDSCELDVIPPNRKAKESLCLSPDFSTCNETGLWKVKDSLTETLCNSHSMLFVKHYLVTSKVYRNVFCFMCNIDQQSQWGTVKDICDDSIGDGPRTTVSFMVILNTVEEDDTLPKTRRCQYDEVEDPLKVSDFVVISLGKSKQ